MTTFSPSPVHDDPRCRLGRRCSEAFTVPTDLRGGRTRLASIDVAAGGLCTLDARAAWWAVYDAAADVAELDDLFTDTTLRSVGTQRPIDMPRATYREQPIELDLAADAVSRELVGELVAWAEALDEYLERHDDERTTGQRWAASDHGRRPWVQAGAAADYLLHHWDVFLALPAQRYRAHGSRARAVDATVVHELDEETGQLWTTRDGGSAACVFLALHHQVAVMAGRVAGLTTYPDRTCPHCHVRGSVTRRAPAARYCSAPLRCSHCHRQIGENEWDAWAELDLPGRVPVRTASAHHGGTPRQAPAPDLEIVGAAA